MKRILLIAIAFGTIAFTETASAQPKGLATFDISNPNVITTGSFIQPAAYNPVSAGAPVQIFPWYTKLDTVNNTGVDTFKQKLAGLNKDVYTWCHVNGISGTNTSCVIKVWASADSGKGVDFVLLQTFTVTATNPVANYTFNSGGIWTYTNFWWTFTGSGTQSSSWYSGFNTR